MLLLSVVLFAAVLVVLGVAAARGMKDIDEILEVADPTPPPADAEG